MKRLLLLFACAASACAQCSGYGTSVNLTIGTVTGTLTNFPLVVSGTFSNIAAIPNGGWATNSSGYDVCFSDATNTTKLTWQTRSWSGSTGAATYVVLVPSVSTGTVIRLWAGNSRVTTFQGGTGTAIWDANFKAVYPLQEATNPYGDMTRNTNNSTAGTYPTRVTGQIGYAQSFTTASTQYIQTVTPVSSGTAISVSALVRAGTNPGANWGIYDSRVNASQLGIILFVTSTNFPDCYYNNLGFAAGPVLDTSWHHLTCTSDGTITRLFVDGSQVATSSTGSAAPMTSGNAYIGAAYPLGSYATGLIQELRISNIARCSSSACGWAKAESDNLLNPTTFVAAGTWGIYVPPAGPVIANTAAAANSPNSILLTWTTETASSSLGKCGTASGGPYTYSTPEVDAVKSGNNYYGRTSHSIAVIVPTTNTSSMAYYCVATSRNTAGGYTTSPEVHAGTLPALTSVPFTVASYSPPTYYNDQANGLHGFRANGRWYDSDTFWGTWADDGYWYVMGNDFHGVNYCCSNNVGVAKMSSDTLTLTQMGNTGGSNNTGPFNTTNYPTTYTADGSRSYAEGIVSVRGKMYQYLPRPACTVIMKTGDHWATTIGPQSNTGPGVSGISFAKGVYDYPTTAAQCSLPTPYALEAARFCRDWGGATGQFPCTHNAGTDGWVYGVTWFDSNVLTFVVTRVRVEDIQITEAGQVAGRYQVYVGSGSGSDGLLDSNWVTFDGVSGTVFTMATTVGHRPQLHWIPAPFNRWATVSYANPSAAVPDQGGSILISDLGAYPWAIDDAVRVASIPKDVVTYPRWYPVFPNLIVPTYADLGNGTAKVRMSSTGSYIEQTSSADTDRYSPVYRDLVLAPRAGVVARQYIGNGRGQHLTSGLDLLYTFDGTSFDTVIPNRASVSGTHNITSLSLMNYSGQGLNVFGYPCGAGYTSQQTVTIATPYNVDLTDFTALATFQHDANGAIPSAETVVDKTDFQVFRNGTTANSWKVKVGGTTSSAFSLTTDGAFATLVVKRVGSAVTVYGSAGIGSSLPLTTLTTFSDGTALGANALKLGSLSGGTQPFYGTLGELGIFSRGLADAELIREVAAVRADMAARNPSVAIP